MQMDILWQFFKSTVTFPRFNHRYILRPFKSALYTLEVLEETWESLFCDNFWLCDNKELMKLRNQKIP